MSDMSDRSINPFWMFIQIVIVVFLAELLIMYAFPALGLDIINPHAIYLIDAAALSAIVSILIYYIQFVPIRNYVRKVYVDDEVLQVANHMYKHGSEALFIVTGEWKIINCNAMCQQMFGMPKEKTLEEKFSSLLDQKHDLSSIIIKLVKKDAWNGELTMRRLNGESFPASVLISKIPRLAGEDSRYVVTVRDDSQRVQAKLDIEYLTKYDTGTNLPNAMMFGHNVCNLIDAKKKSCSGIDCDECDIWQSETCNIAVVVYKLKGLREVADVYGEKQCNDLLAHIAADLTAFVDECSMARLSNDEISVVVSRYFDEDDLHHKIKKISAIIGEERLLSGNRVSIRTSCGLAKFPQHGVTQEEIVHHAKMAMSRAEQNGSGTLVEFDNSMIEDLVAKQRLQAHLINAVKEMNFHIVYQPQASMEDAGFLGVEALLRWNGIDGNPVSPAVFVPELERIGKIYEVGLWVLETSCRQGCKWIEEGLPSFTIAVNVSALQLLNENFSRDVLSVLAKTHFPASSLELELTESCLVRDPEATEKLMNDLGAIGVKISIDDFGTGYSSLAYLKRFKTLDKLKIDKSFVDAIADSRESVITNAIIGLAKSLNLRAIAEGVECEMQAEYLRSHGCDEVQGYLISRPLSPDQLSEYVLHGPFDENKSKLSVVN